jgi:hypothetical protein
MIHLDTRMEVRALPCNSRWNAWIGLRGVVDWNPMNGCFCGKKHLKNTSKTPQTNAAGVQIRGHLATCQKTGLIDRRHSKWARNV